MKVKVIAYKGHIVTIPVEPEIGVNSKKWVPAGDDQFGPAVAEEYLGFSKEAIKLLDLVKKNNDGVGDLMWSHGAFSWFGSNYRVIDPRKVQAARDFRIGEFTEIDNDQLTPFEKKAVEHAIRVRSHGWKWPYRLNKKPQPNDTAYKKFRTQYHAGIVYLVSPYSDEDKGVVKQRTDATIEVAAKLVKREVHAISPIVYGTRLMETGHMKEDDSWKSWQHFCNALIDTSEAVYVVKLEGWDKSLGVGGEILRAATRGIACFLIDPDTLELEPMPGKLPLYKMEKKDIIAIAEAYGCKYSHHETDKMGDKIFMAKDVKVTIYSNNGPPSLAITGDHKVVDPVFAGMEDFLLNAAKDMPDTDPKKKEFTERHERMQRGHAAAQKILEKYL